jgi:arginase family enzyme
MDVLDPAYAPGVSHHEPGGMSTRKVLRLIQSIQSPIVGADIVEYNPDRDVNGITAAVAAKLLKEIAGSMLGQKDQ